MSDKALELDLVLFSDGRPPAVTVRLQPSPAEDPGRNERALTLRLNNAEARNAYLQRDVESLREALDVANGKADELLYSLERAAQVLVGRVSYLELAGEGLDDLAEAVRQAELLVS